MFLPTTKYLILGLLVVNLLVFAVGAVGEDISAFKIDLNPSGITTNDKTSIDLSNGEMNFTDLKSGMSINTRTKINGVDFIPDAMVTVNGETKFARAAIQPTGGKLIGKGDLGDIKPIRTIEPIGGVTPDVSVSYTYTGDAIKETIVLQQDAELSFPVTIPDGQKLISWEINSWKVVNATNGNTMRGIESGVPYGIDAAGRYIPMNYTWDGTELYLNYNRTITVINFTQTLASHTRVYDYYEIEYPLTIDPTWTSVGDHWVAIDGLYTIIKWNATGTTSWTVPDGVTNLAYVVVGGGGAGGAYNGGGGGAGGMSYHLGTAITPGETLEVKVGQAPENNAGTNSTFGGVVVSGGGMGGSVCAYFVPTSGGSGGGGASNVVEPCYSNYGASGIAGQGNAGGDGWLPVLGGAGGGGGKNSAGTDGGIYSYGADGGSGGSGYASSITGVSTRYAGGGGGSGYPVWVEDVGWVTGYGGSGGSNIGGHGRGLYNNGTSFGCTPPTPSTGSGGGGCDWMSQSKGSAGVVIVRYLTPPTPVASFTPSLTSGEAPLTLQFIDTSTGSPSAWNWSYTNTSPGNGTEIWFSTLHYPVVTLGQGNWSIRLNASNSNGYNLSTQVTYINITPQPPVVASFVPSVTTGYAPLLVQFFDQSTGYPTSWNWSYKNVTGNNTEIWFSTLQNPIISLGIGNWSIKLNATSPVNSNISTQITYINVSYDGGSGYGGIGLLSLDGYIKDAETAAVINGANIVVLQSTINISLTTNETGYYYATNTNFGPGTPMTVVVSAPGYETTRNTSTPINVVGIMRINQTLLSLTPDTDGPTLMGIVRVPPFNITVDDATIVITNSTGEEYTVTTNSAGYYRQERICIPSGWQWYDVWGSKNGLVNSTVYTVNITGGNEWCPT